MRTLSTSLKSLFTATYKLLLATIYALPIFPVPVTFGTIYTDFELLIIKSVTTFTNHKNKTQLINYQTKPKKKNQKYEFFFK